MQTNLTPKSRKVKKMEFFIGIGKTWKPESWWNGKQFQPDLNEARAYSSVNGANQAKRRGSKCLAQWEAQLDDIDAMGTLWTISTMGLERKGLI